ncbi:MAG: hypothetical protein ACTHKU_12595 [Verrucomicrobiota bacterium]
MLALDGQPLTEIYDPSPYHRFQADALLHGHFYLYDSIEAIQPGLAWHDGKVQQIWGLGIAFWLLPFEAVARLLSGISFPDRIALGIAFASLAFFTGNTCLRLARAGKSIFGLGLLWLVILSPGVWTLARNSRLIFEETVLYAILLSLAILVSLVRLILFGSRQDFWSCCFLGSFAIWVRPTHAVYGVGAVVLASAILWRRERKWRLPTGGLLICVSSGILLVWTNYVRFGSPTEFGHRLTVSSGSMVYLTRFGNPFKEAPLVDAAKELFGVLFLNSNAMDVGAFSEDMFPLQSSFTRWRRLDLTTFDLSWLALVLSATASCIMCFFDKKYEKADRGAVVAVFLWAGAALVGLFTFYLYYPTIASRYVLDFTPALTGFIVVLFLIASRRWGKLMLAWIAVWLISEILCSKAPILEQYVFNDASQSKALPRSSGADIAGFKGVYTKFDHPSKTGIPCNGRGWDTDSGFAANVIMVMVEKPDFLELVISQRRMQNGVPAKTDIYRAKIDGEWLNLEKVEHGQENLRVLFRVPDSVRSRKNDEVIFICFSKGFDAEDRNSDRILESIRWH